MLKVPQNLPEPKPQAEVDGMYDTTGIIGITPEDLEKAQTLTTSISALIGGLPGSGKTTLLGTSCLPLLIYSFDPKSTQVLWSYYPKLMQEQWIVALPFWDEPGYQDPRAYDAWEKVWENHAKKDFWSRFGTIATDSFSGWLNAAGNKWLHYKNTKRKAKGGEILDHLAQGDYPGLYNICSGMVHQMQAGPWNYLATVHLEIIRDEESGVDRRVEYLLYKKLRAEIPRLFTENYILRKKPTGPGEVKVELLTDVTGIYNLAKSQLRGDGKLKVKEEPNLRALYQKVGKPFKDLPHWRTNQPLTKDLLPEHLRKYV